LTKIDEIFSRISPQYNTIEIDVDALSAFATVTKMNNLLINVLQMTSRIGFNSIFHGIKGLKQSRLFRACFTLRLFRDGAFFLLL
jgi:hypothetical protein